MYNEVLKNNEIVHDLTYDHLKKKILCEIHLNH